MLDRAPDRFLEVRTYRVFPGRRSAFDKLFREGAVPLLEKFGVRVVGFGPSLHDDDGYYLARAYPSLRSRQEALDHFYGSMEWLTRFDGQIMALIDQYATTVVEVEPGVIDALTASLVVTDVAA